MPSPDLLVIYRWNPDEGGLSPDVLGESIAGFGTTFGELLKTIGIESPVSIRVNVADEGSIELGFTLQAVSQVLFPTWTSLYDVYTFVGAQGLLEGAKAFAAVRDDLNAYFATRPIDMAFAAFAITKLLDVARKQKRAPATVDSDGKPIPKAYTAGLQRMVKKGSYKKAMRPFVQNQASEVEVKTKSSFGVASTKITASDFGDYLDEKEKILPAFENGKRYRLAAQLVGLEKSMGEHLKFKLLQHPRPHPVLMSYVEDDKATTDYTDFYGKEVVIDVEVIRYSMYSKPKLKLLSIELAQSSFL